MPVMTIIFINSFNYSLSLVQAQIVNLKLTPVLPIHVKTVAHVQTVLVPSTVGVHLDSSVIHVPLVITSI